MRSGAILLAMGCLIAGCLIKPDPLGTSDAQPITGDASGVGCATTPFTGPPQILAGTQGHVTGDPTIRADLLELFFAHDRGNGQLEIWTATRQRVTDAFSVAPGPVSFSGGAAHETDPSVSADGSVLAFVSDRNGMPQAHIVYHSAFGWSGAMLVPGIDPTLQVRAVSLSGDGKTLYLVDLISTLHIATAPSPSGPFTERAKTFGTGFNYPTISSDGLELYYTPNGSLFHSVRPDQASDFPKGTDTGFTVYDPDLTPDGQTLVLGDGSSVLFLTRTCPTQ